MFRSLLIAAVLVLAAAAIAQPEPGQLVFVESVPMEADLDLPDVPDAPGVWLDLVESAQTSLDIFTFYFSPNPDGVGALQPVLAAVEDRAKNGVTVRALSEHKFYKTYPETHDRLVANPTVEARLLDLSDSWGGVLHAKGMIIDGERFYLGSQNWDWRALEHIHELGIVVNHQTMAADLGRLYALDWAMAGGEELPPLREAVPDTAEWGPVRMLTTSSGSECEAVLAASPRQGLPEGIPWDLPLLVDLIDNAASRVRLQLLSYNPGDRDGGWWPALDNALRQAASRGCTVELLFSNWAKRHYMLHHIKSLSVLKNIEVRFSNIPEWSGGFVPFARVDHAKFVTCDGNALWLGTSNGSRDYFYSSRNLSLFLRGEGCTEVPDAFFERSWTAEHTETVDPCGEYEPPRRQ